MARRDPLDQGAVQAVGRPALIPAPAVAVVVPISLKCRGRWPLVQVAPAHADRQIQPEGTGDRALLSKRARRDDGDLDREGQKKKEKEKRDALSDLSVSCPGAHSLSTRRVGQAWMGSLWQPCHISTAPRVTRWGQRVHTHTHPPPSNALL